MVQDYGFDKIHNLKFSDDDSLFTGSNIDMLMDDVLVGLPYEIDDGQCFDAGFPLDMPPLMKFGVKEEINSHGNA